MQSDDSPEVSEEVERLRTFFGWFYHDNDDIVGTTRALEYLLGKGDYRRDLAYAFKRVLQSATTEQLLDVTRNFANRNTENREEAARYLQDIFLRNLFQYDLDEGDEIPGLQG